MGGEYYNNPGGGASYLCLPHNPKYDKYKDRHQAVGYVCSTEYKVNDYNRDPFKRNLHNHDAPCVVCFVKSRGSMLMMPARNDCPSGWIKEYHGYLMTAYHKTTSIQATSFVLMGIRSMSLVAMPTKTVPCCTLWKEIAAHSHVFLMSAVEN